MLVAFTFRAKPGHEKEFQDLLNNPELGRRAARALGATRNILFLEGGRMVRVFEFPDGTRPRPLVDAAKDEPVLLDFLRRLGPLVEDGFDVERPETLDAFNKRVMVPLAFDVHP